MTGGNHSERNTPKQSDSYRYGEAEEQTLVMVSVRPSEVSRFRISPEDET